MYKKILISLFLILSSISMVFATETNTPVTDPAVTTEDTTIDESETIEYEGADIIDVIDVTDDTELNEGESFLYLTGVITGDTNVVSDEIYIGLYNYDNGTTSYAKLTRENNYTATIALTNGLYDASPYRYDERDTISFDNDGTFTIENANYTLSVYITGVSDSAYEDAQLTQEIVNGDVEVEVEEDLSTLPIDEDVESAQNGEDTTTSETSNNENTEESGEVIISDAEEKEETKSVGQIVLGFIIDNLFILILLVGSIWALAIYKWKQSNNK